MTASPHPAQSPGIRGASSRNAAYQAALDALAEAGAGRALICEPASPRAGAPLVVRLSSGIPGASNKILAAAGIGPSAAETAFAAGSPASVVDYRGGGAIPTTVEKTAGAGVAVLAAVPGQGRPQALVVALVDDGAAPERVAAATAAVAAALAQALPGLRARRPATPGSEMLLRDEVAQAIQQCLEIVELEPLSNRVLDHCRRFTGAEFGFVAFVDPETEFLVAPTMTRDIFDQCRVAGKTITFERPGGIGGWVVDNRQPLIANEPEAHPASVGTPPGHLPIRRFMGVPCMFQSDLHGMIALANKPTPFDTADLALVSTFGGLYAAAVARHFSESALRASEARLAAAQAKARLGNWSWTPAGGELRWSAEVYRIFGLAPDAPVDIETFLAAVHPADRAAVENTVARMAAAGDAAALDYRILRPDGDTRHVHEEIDTQRDEAGVVIRAWGTIQDVTELRTAETALQRANRALRTLSACNAILVHARDEVRLLDQMCQGAVGSGGYPYAGIWLTRDGTLTPAAAAGTPCACFAEERGGIGPAVTRAWQERRAVVERRGCVGEGPGGCSLMALPLPHDGAILGVLAIEMPEADAFDDEERALLTELAADTAFGLDALRVRQDRQRTHEALWHGLEAAIQAIASALEARDPYTAGHQRRVADLAAAIAREMGLAAEAVHGIHLAGSIHDIGKMAVPAEILTRPGRISDLEMALIRTHPQIGHDIIKGVDFPWPIRDTILHHHEKLDGSGYPLGLAGEAIALEARIVAVADIVEAMASHRPYRPALGVEVALAEIEKDAGTRLDADAVRACARLFRDKGYAFPR